MPIYAWLRGSMSRKMNLKKERASVETGKNEKLEEKL